MFSFFRKKLPAPTPTPAPAATPAPSAPVATSAAFPIWTPTPTGSYAPPAPVAPSFAPAARTQAPPAPALPAGGGSLIGSALVTPMAIPVPAPVAAERQGWMDKLSSGLRKTSSNIAQVFTGAQIDDNLYEELESALLMADTGVKATEFLLADVKRRVAASGATRPVQVKNILIASLTELLKPLERPLVIGEFKPTVIMVAGVNGAGKTTSIGKLTKHLANDGASVLLAAADTYRAAAREQLAVWADRNTVEIVSQEGGDPAAVSFDAVTAGKARGKDVVLVDTAGRLPTQLHLMEELKKIKRVIQKAGEADARAAAGPPRGGTTPSAGSAGASAASVGAPLPPHEVILVIDGNTGQNALIQVKAFDDALKLTGLIVTKLDGTAKGGVLAAIAQEKPVPVYFIGVGEKLEDLETFSAREFALALLA
jgi:fused signal recognition particle receptor